MITSTTSPIGDFDLNHAPDEDNIFTWTDTITTGSVTPTINWGAGTGTAISTTPSITISSPGYTGSYTIPYNNYVSVPCIITKEMFELRNIGNFGVATHSQIFIDKRIKSKILAEKAIFKQIQDSLTEGGKIYWIEDHDNKQQTAASRIGSINS
jgi:hypothetical protein